MKALRIITLPFSLLWSLILWLRHLGYDLNVLKSEETPVPAIVVGNLAFGGTGKTPHVLWLCEHFNQKNVAVLSRGHGRSTQGYLAVSESETAAAVGDEPLLMAKRATQASFHVCENRNEGIRKILMQTPNTDLVILDDAYQHRAVRARLNILLTTFQKPYSEDCVVPCGTLRDLKSRRRQAEIVIVTKCPDSPINIPQWRSKLQLQQGQSLFFTKVAFRAPQELLAQRGRPAVAVPSNAAIVALSGIANPQAFNTHVLKHHENVQIAAFKDHHAFSSNDIADCLSKIANFADKEKWFVTTEKDAVRLEPFIEQIHKAGVRIAILPIDVVFVHGEAEFKEKINGYVGQD